MGTSLDLRSRDFKIVLRLDTLLGWMEKRRDVRSMWVLQLLPTDRQRDSFPTLFYHTRRISVSSSSTLSSSFDDE